MSGPFSVLGDNAKAIRRAELGALLHNIGKMLPDFSEVIGPPKIYGQYDYKMIAGRAKLWGAKEGERAQSEKNARIWKERTNDDGRFFQREVGLPGALSHSNPTVAVGDLVEFHDFKQPRGLLCFLMALAHLNASGMNKRILEKEVDQSGKMVEIWNRKDDERGSEDQVDAHGKPVPWKSATVFGFEIEVPKTGSMAVAACMQNAKDAADTSEYEPWRRTVDGILSEMEPFLADSQRPINDTRISDMALFGAAFLKAAVAHCLLLGGRCTEDSPPKVSWQLLRIAVSGQEFVHQAVRIPDLLARRELLRDTQDRIRKKLEWDLLLGNEIYRDESGSVFIMPPLTAGLKKSLLQELIGVLEESQIAEEAAFKDEWSKSFALGPEGGYSFQMGELLERPAPPLQGSVSRLRQAWAGKTGREICSVCGLRPFGSSRKCKERRVCITCEERRDDRSLRWLSSADCRTQTIWIDEAADRNGRIVLFCARLRLGQWLNDDGFIERSFLLDPASNRHMSPSFARLQRVWTTSTDFWGQVLDKAKEASGTHPGRLNITGAFETRNGGQVIRSHVYYLEKQRRRFSVVCKNASSRQCDFLLAENPERACHLFDLKVKGSDPRRFLKALQSILTGEWTIEEPTGYGSPNRILGTLAPFEPGGVLGGEIDEQAWTPVIEILRDPAMLMFLAPATGAMETVRSTLDLYQCQMGKVRDRLGLDVGLVYAPGDIPLPALVQAGHAMLSRPSLRKAWRVGKAENQDTRVGVKFDGGPEWQLTADRWRGNIETESDGWTAFTELQSQGSATVQVSESTFDFEFLETSGRRFDVAYEPARAKRLSAEKARRPWLLEDTIGLRRCWDILQKRLATAQIKGIDGILHAKAEEWGSANVPSAFVRSVLLASNWQPSPPPPDDLDFLVRAAGSGMLADAVELFLSVAKASWTDVAEELSGDDPSTVVASTRAKGGDDVPISTI